MAKNPETPIVMRGGGVVRMVCCLQITLLHEYRARAVDDPLPEDEVEIYVYCDVL
jgi:hypothetical protein